MKHLVLTLVSLGMIGCYGAPSGGGGGNGPAVDEECQLQQENERTPGYPFDLQAYGEEVLPVLTSSCAASGCHGPPAGVKGFTVWPEAAPGNCDFAKTFNSLAGFVDLANPTNSAVYLAINGANPAHPVSYPEGDPKLAAILNYATSASQIYLNDGGNGTPAPPGPSPFDYTVYQQTIQPMLDNAEGRGCATAGCHGTGAGGLTLVAQPAPDSADMQANFLAVTQRANLQTPETSLILLKGQNRHAGGSSPVFSPAQAQDMLNWISAAKDVADGNTGGNPQPGDNPPPGGGNGPNPAACAPVDTFNLAVFRDEIMPILDGEIDLNDRNGGTTAGCTSGPCHGTPRGPGSLTLQRGGDPAANLQSFACFVNLLNPSGSQILACPLNDPRCRRFPHPGQDVFAGAEDLNYQRLLAFLYGARLQATPLDFAFFVRRVNTIFNDPNAVENGAQNRTCADTVACHGVAAAGQSVPNGSNFPLIPNADDPARLAFNFVSAASFANFLNPGESSLFLYPTNEIANVDAHPLATGLPHPGGKDFEPDSAEALAILTWAQGLRPDRRGFQRNWLVAGDYPGTRITDTTFIDERRATPRIFDPTGVVQFNNGEWDGLFSDREEVDLNQVFPRNATTGRIAYAAAYVINITARPIRAELAVSSPNAVRLYVGDSIVTQSDNGQITALAEIPPFTSAGSPTRILLKVLQRATDSNFGFSMQLRDELGNLLTDQTGELVFVLGPEGGI